MDNLVCQLLQSDSSFLLQRQLLPFSSWSLCFNNVQCYWQLCLSLDYSLCLDYLCLLFSRATLQKVLPWTLPTGVALPQSSLHILSRSLSLLLQHCFCCMRPSGVQGQGLGLSNILVSRKSECHKQLSKNVGCMEGQLNELVLQLKCLGK